MKTIQKLTLLFGLLIILQYNAAAQESAAKPLPVKLLIKGALEFGGDKVAEVYFTNGEKQSVNAGQGGTLSVGAQLQIPSVEKLLFHASVGYKYVTTQADNVHIRLTRVPIQLTANWMIADRLRIGAGLATHRAIKFNADNLGEDITFSAATGPTFEIAYRGIGLCYTAMTYKDHRNNKYAANAIGVLFSLAVPNK